MINQVSLRKRVKRNVLKRVCSYCDLVFKGRRAHGDRNKIHLTQRRNNGEEFIDLKADMSWPRWGVWRDCGEEIIDLTKHLPELRWGVRRVCREIVVQDDAVQEGDANVVEEKASEVDDGDVMNEEISTSKSFSFDLNEFPPAEERDD